MSSSILVTPNTLFEAFALLGYYAVSIGIYPRRGTAYLFHLQGPSSPLLNTDQRNWNGRSRLYNGWTKVAICNWTNFVQFENYRLGCDAVSSLTEIHRRFKDKCYLHHHVRCTLIIETIVSSDTSLNFTTLQCVTSKKTNIFRYSPWASFKPYVRIPHGSNITIRSGFLSIFPRSGTAAHRNQTKHKPYYRAEEARGWNIGLLVLSETADRAEVVMLSTIWQQLGGKENTTSRAQANITSTDR